MTQEELLNKILTKLVNLDESFREFRTVELDEKLNAMESRILSHVDGFIKLHEAVMLELTAMRSSHKRLEERIQKIELKLGLVTA